MRERLDSADVLDPSAEPARERARPANAAAAFLGLLRGFPTLAVLLALAGLAYWGQRTGWTLPKFSSLASSALDDPDDWCNEHGVPESLCVECKPSLLPKAKEFGWCKQHGVPDCLFEHAELAQLQGKPKISQADLARASRALGFAERPENNPKCKLHLRRLQLASQAAFDKAGIEVEPVWQSPVVEAVTGNGEITYDQTRTAHLSARVPGTVFRVYRQAGDPVKQGEVLALVDAAAVGKAKAEFLQALVQVRLREQALERMGEAYQHGALPERSYRDQAAALSEARIRLTTAQEAMTNLGLPVDPESLQSVPQEKLADRLRFLGLPGSVIGALDAKKTTGNLLALTAPFDGVVVTRQVVSGEVVDSSRVLFVTVDVHEMWLTLDLRLEDVKLVTLGKEVRFWPAGGKEARGKITWMSTAADQKTRMLRVRASLDNSEGRLRANTFGSGKVILREERQAVVVPNTAVHWDGCCHVVFIRDKDYFKEGAPKVFHVRKVRVGAIDEKYTEIAAGVLPEEVVATKGSGVLRAELLKNNLGAG